ncbi:MAG TPA: 1-deoxy-D-xylulose-5-phosphate reductoisomerase [Candidatus Caenarcaniphilales bacterium]|nr:1-deoxy-D-xylulose-5-phosphate reductoisomerase [Candidatus Caenarcaniphilales bacterium]
MAERTRVALLGSTGSIGRQALDVLAQLETEFDVIALAAGRDAATLASQASRHRPAAVYIADESISLGLELPSAVTLERGSDALERLATREDVDLVLVATAGIVSLRPVIAALSAGKVVATANKETLVAGGHLVMPLARQLAGDGESPLNWLRPIDSEHSAIWQCLVGEPRSDVARLILTASGGPFREWAAERLAGATPADALAHPTWSMGAKITIDSATLINKGLEVIEARWLYDVDDARIDVVIHPQSIVHSMVEFADGSLKAQLGLPDMRIPIQYALTYPARLPSPAPRVVATDLPALTFEAPDETRFPGLPIARDAGRRGPRASTALIAADEIAVSRFLDGSLDFVEIPSFVAAAVERFAAGEAAPSVDELISLDQSVREWAATAQPARAS